MKEQYDFGVRKPLKENKIVTDNFSDIVKQYDFIEENAWAQVAKFGADIANKGYRSNMLRGAGAGAVIGGAGNVVKNMTKRDDDPTKKGVLGSMISGATGGAVAGAGLGAGARFAARTSLGKAGIKTAGENAIRTATQGLEGSAATQAKQKVINYMNSGDKAGWLGGGNYFNKAIGWNNAGELRKNTQAFGKGWTFDGDLVAGASSL